MITEKRKKMSDKYGVDKYGTVSDWIQAGTEEELFQHQSL